MGKVGTGLQHKYESTQVNLRSKLQLLVKDKEFTMNSKMFLDFTNGAGR